MKNKKKTYFWLSFCDGDLPPGSQFLGACIVEAADGIEAVCKSHQLGINPGGEVLMAGPFSANLKMLKDHPHNKLLQKSDIVEPVNAFSGEPA